MYYLHFCTTQIGWDIITKFSTRLKRGNYFAFFNVEKELVLLKNDWIFEFSFAGHPVLSIFTFFPMSCEMPKLLQIQTLK